MIGFLLFEKIHGKSNIGSSRIRGYWMIKYWPEAELYKYGKKYDAMIFQKAYQPDYCKLYDGIKILDMCDPDWIEFLPIKETIEEVDGITVSNAKLKDFLKNITDKPIKVIDDRHDMEVMKQKKIHKGKAKKVCWYGYAHNAYTLMDCIKSVIDYDLELTIISDTRVSLAEMGYSEMKGKEKWIKWNGKTINDDILQSDIVLLPPPLKPQHQYKSNNKETGAWAIGMPVAKTREDLERLLDEKERIKESNEKWEIAHRDYDVKKSVEEMKEFINECRIHKVSGKGSISL